MPNKDLIYRILLMTLAIMLGCYMIYAVIDVMVATLYFMMTKPLYALGWLAVIASTLYLFFRWKDGRF